MRARYQNVESEIFTTKDSYEGILTEVYSLNRYAYVQGNPVNFKDPSGYTSREILNGFMKWYLAGVYDSKQIAAFTVLVNGAGIKTALHEIAQLNVAKYLYDTGYMPQLEYPIHNVPVKQSLEEIANGSDAAAACTTKEADVVADNTFVWEIKSLTACDKPSEIEKAKR